MKIRLAAPIQYDSIVDGEGVRAVIWTQGCPHHCPGCQNPMTHDLKGGFIADIEDLKEELLVNMNYHDGITLSGGDPFIQIDAILELAKYIKKLGKTVWAYTGFTYEELLKQSEKNSNLGELLKNLDVLVDGKFILAEKSLDLHYKGSKNQRVIDVKESLKKHKVVLVKKYEGLKNYENIIPKENYIFV